MSGYGDLFRGVHQLVQGTALGVVTTFGVGETSSLEAPVPAILQPSPRPGLTLERRPLHALDLPLEDPAAPAVRPVPGADPAPPPRALPAPLDSGAPADPPPALLAETAASPAAPQAAFALPLVPRDAVTVFDAPADPLGAEGSSLLVPAEVASALARPTIGDDAAALLEPAGGTAAALDAMPAHGDAAQSSASWMGSGGARRDAALALGVLESRTGTAGAATGETGPGSAAVDRAHALPPLDSATIFAPAASGDATRHFAGGPLSTAPDRDGDEPASDVPAPDLDVGSDATAADGQAKEGDLLSLATLSRGGLALSGGYSSIEGPIGSIKLARTNIGAPGRDMTVSARYSKVQTLVEFGLTDGNFMGSKLAVAPTLFYSRSTAAGFDKQIRASLFVQTARGINVYVGRPLDRGLRVAANYRYSDEDFLIRQENALCDVALHGSPFCNAIGRSTSSVLSLSLSLDRRDSAINPTRGFQLRITQDIAGPGGTTRYIRLRAGGTFHRRLGGNIDASFGLEGGYLKGYDGRDVPLFDRFYIGGNSMRGFDLRGMGPKVVPTAAAPGQTTAIGGRAYYVGRVEISMRLDGALDKFGVSPSIFVDAGSVFGARKSGLLPGELLIGNSAKPRVAAGIGLSFNVSPGKLRFNIAKPIARQTGDRSQTFSITFGTAF